MPDRIDDIKQIVEEILQQISVPDDVDLAALGLNIGGAVRSAIKTGVGTNAAVGPVAISGASITKALGIGGGGPDLNIAGKVVDAFIEQITRLCEAILKEFPKFGDHLRDMLEALAKAIQAGASSDVIKVIFIDTFKKILDVANEDSINAAIAEIAGVFADIIVKITDNDALQGTVVSLFKSAAEAVKKFMERGDLAGAFEEVLPLLGVGIEALYSHPDFNTGMAGMTSPLARAVEAIFAKPSASVDLSDPPEFLPTEFTKALTGVSPILARATSVFGEALLKVFSGNLLRSADGSLTFEQILEGFPCGLGARSKGTLNLLFEWKAVAEKINPQLLADAKLRLSAVRGSLEVLGRLAAGAEGQVQLFSVTRLTASLTAIIDAVLDIDINATPNVIAEALARVVVETLQGLFFPIDALVELLESIIQGKFGAWVQMPCGISAGALHEWINDCDGFTVDLQLEREFRLRLLSALDAFASSKMKFDTSGGKGQIAVDGQLTSELAAELVGTLFSEIANFILQPPCSPSLNVDLDLENFGDVSGNLAVLLSRQQKLALRAGIGMSLRGVWEWSLHNEALIELAGSALGSAFSSIFEAVVLNVAGSISVNLVYRGDPVSGIEIKRWPSLDEATCSSPNTSPLEFVLSLRIPQGALSDDEVIKIRAAFDEYEAMLGLAYDFGAYQEMAYSTFPARRLFPKSDLDFAFTQAKYFRAEKKLELVVEADSVDSTRAVVRAYFGCQRYILSPPNPGSVSWARTWTNTLDVPKTIRLLSSDGREETVLVDIV